MPLQHLSTISQVNQIAPYPVANRLHFVRSEDQNTLELAYWDLLSGKWEVYHRPNRPAGTNALVWLENHLYAWIGHEKRSVLYPFTEKTAQPSPFIFHVRTQSPSLYIGKYSGPEEGQIFMRFNTEKHEFSRLNIPPTREVLHSNENMALFFSRNGDEIIWEGWDLQTEQLIWQRSVHQICKELGVDTFQGASPAREVVHDTYCLMGLRNHGLLCLDWKTGNINWFQAQAYDMVRLHENQLVQVDAIFCKEVDLITGGMFRKIDISKSAISIGMTTPANNLFGVTDTFIVRPDLRHGIIAVHNRVDGQLYDHFRFDPSNNVRLSRQFAVSGEDVWSLTADSNLYHFKLT